MRRTRRLVLFLAFAAGMLATPARADAVPASPSPGPAPRTLNYTERVRFVGDNCTDDENRTDAETGIVRRIKKMFIGETCTIETNASSGTNYTSCVALYNCTVVEETQANTRKQFSKGYYDFTHLIALFSTFLFAFGIYLTCVQVRSQRTSRLLRSLPRMSIPLAKKKSRKEKDPVGPAMRKVVNKESWRTYTTLAWMNSDTYMVGGGDGTGAGGGGGGDYYSMAKDHHADDARQQQELQRRLGDRGWGMVGTREEGIDYAAAVVRGVRDLEQAAVAYGGARLRRRHGMTVRQYVDGVLLGGTGGSGNSSGGGGGGSLSGDARAGPLRRLAADARKSMDGGWRSAHVQCEEHCRVVMDTYERARYSRQTLDRDEYRRFADAIDWLLELLQSVAQRAVPS